MSLAPTPSAARGDLILQSPFFTSSLFVDPFRADIEQLIDLFVQEYADHAAKPFALFKRIWQEQGWTYMHLKIFDARTRHTYLTVACRLFIGAYFLYYMNALIIHSAVRANCRTRRAHSKTCRAFWTVHLLFYATIGLSNAALLHKAH
jgi:hypothetical protein